MKALLEGGVILAGLKLETESGNYSEEKKIWEVGSEVGHAASKYWMQQTVVVADEQDAAAVAFAFLYQGAWHMLAAVTHWNPEDDHDESCSAHWTAGDDPDMIEQVVQLID